MGSKLLDKKRKARVAESESDDDNELATGVNFDGVLSGSEDDSDFVASDEEEDESDMESGSEEDDEAEDDAILSDDIPSDLDEEDVMAKLRKQTEDIEIEEPGVDPKPKDTDDGDRNYRVETDANGGVRYVYECVPHSCSWRGRDRRRTRPGTWCVG